MNTKPWTCRARASIVARGSRCGSRCEPLQKCPQCSGRIERLISACGISTHPSERSMLSDKNLKAKGFKKLVNEGGGKFRRVT